MSANCFDCKVHFNFHDDIRKHKNRHHIKDVNLQLKSKAPQMRVSILYDASNGKIDTGCNYVMAIKKIETPTKTGMLTKC